MQAVDEFKQLPARTKALLLFLVLAIISMLFTWYSPEVPASRTYAQAPAIKGTANLPKTAVPVVGGTVKVLPKKLVNKVTPLPDEVINDDEKEVTATGEIPPSENGSKVVSVIDTKTGDTVLITKVNPPPLFAFENKRRIGVGYGIGTAGPTAKLFGEYTFLRVGNFHLSAEAEINATATRQTEAKAMAQIDYRW
ncbi:hypothetical protein [Geobacter sp. SVR]|uniref:hypothetical protein n=1 Tax=Geobacter sp. SVR TaxID=2495594 RepID=UPI00143EF8AD|nr:hypothetical protein [Geobacter sp. SVR]BCS54061.1 hypothetical protein GSVR_23690 [Geobacter sp. SVR]GCF87544.1 hypothetical protein GSbR_41440 [Geobacter sp. SVR]